MGHKSSEVVNGQAKGVVTMNRHSDPKAARRGFSWLVGGFAVIVLYVLSSGPVLALAFWLRETTHNDLFYSAIWLYYPVFMLGQQPDGLLMRYIEWWVVDVFQTVGPG